MLSTRDYIPTCSFSFATISRIITELEYRSSLPYVKSRWLYHTVTLQKNQGAYLSLGDHLKVCGVRKQTKQKKQAAFEVVNGFMKAELEQVSRLEAVCDDGV